jgi:hypothetical protein
VLTFSIAFPMNEMILDIQKVQAQIRRIAQTGFRGIALGRHCREESMPGRNVDFQDILNVLNWGLVIHDPDINCNMKFKVNGSDCDGEPLTVVIILQSEISLFVKTVW